MFLNEGLILLVITALLMYMGIVRIGETEVGLVIKKFSLNPRHSSLPSDGLIALNGEAGWQADTLAPGSHWGYWPWAYTIRRVPLISVPPGQIALVFAKDGEPIPPERTLGKVVDCKNFQDARAFLMNGGQRGRQLDILAAGVYRINTSLFTIITTENAPDHGMKPKELHVYTIDTDKIGIVTTEDGASLPKDEVAGPRIEGHHNFQSGQKFLDNGGYKGLQEEILAAGSWTLNPWFVRVEQVSLTSVLPGTVGVVISHVGKDTENGRSDDLVDSGYKGIWKTPLYPGQHPINTKVMNVEIVPTNMIALDWSNKPKPAWHYDAKLQALEVHSKDRFPFWVEVTQKIRISGKDAPKMISFVGSPAAKESHPVEDSEEGSRRYNSIRNLITKALEPLISAYFKISAQDHEVLDFHDHRSERQREAADHIKMALIEYGVQSEGTFILDIDVPNSLEELVQERKFSEEKRKLFQKDQEKEEEHRKLALAEENTKAEQQLVREKNQLDIARFITERENLRIQVEADSIRKKAEAEADALKIRETTRIQLALEEEQSRVEIARLNAEARSFEIQTEVKAIRDKAEAEAYGLQRKEQAVASGITEKTKAWGSVETHLESNRIDRLPTELPTTLVVSNSSENPIQQTLMADMLGNRAFQKPRPVNFEARHDRLTQRVTKDDSLERSKLTESEEPEVVVMKENNAG